MKLNLMSSSIRNRIYSIIFLFLFSALASALIISLYQDSTNKVNLHLRAFYNLQNEFNDLQSNSSKVFARNIFDFKEDLQKQEKTIYSNLQSLKNGGKVSYFDDELDELPPSLDNDYLTLLSSWSNVDNNLSKVYDLPQKMDSSYNEEKMIAINDSISHTVLIDKVVLVDNIVMKKVIKNLLIDISNIQSANLDLINGAFQELNIRKFRQTQTLIFIILFNIAMFAFAIYWMRKKIILPIHTVGQKAELLANGDLNTRIDIIDNNEIGVFAKAINSLATYLQNATEFVREIGDGNLNSTFKDAQVEMTKEGSLVHALFAMKDKLKSVSQEDDKRNWATEGIAKFANIIRNNNENLNALSSILMSTLVEYTGTNQGCMYIHQKDDQGNESLHLSSFYAFDTEKFYKEQIKLGESIVGQTFLEKKTTYLAEIPSDYMKLKSGLGNIEPQAILIVPLIVNEQAYGIIELASFKEIEQYKIEFIEQLGEMIASAISSVRNNEQTKKLLHESQQLAEQMRSQEEEMRQNMEELAATQEEMDRKENQTQSVINAIENNFITAEFSIDLELINGNRNFLKIVHSLHLDDISGNPLTSFIEGDNIDTLLSSLKNKESFDGYFSINNLPYHIVFAFAKSTYDSEDTILLFANKAETLVAGNEDKYILEMEEELRQNLDSLQITETSLNAKIQNLKLIDELIGVCILEDQLVVYSNEKAKNELGFSEKADSFSSILTTEEVEKIENSYKKEMEITVTTIINKKEMKLIFSPIKNTNKQIVLIYS